MKISALAKRMTIAILIITLVCVAGSVIYYRSLAFLPFIIGAFLGAGISICKVFLLEHAVNRAITMEKQRSVNYITLQNLLRMLLSGVALLLGALIPQMSLWGTAAGILAFPIATYGERFKSKRSKEGDENC